MDRQQVVFLEQLTDQLEMEGVECFSKCFTIFNADKGVVVAVADNQILNIRLLVTRNPQMPLQWNEHVRVQVSGKVI